MPFDNYLQKEQDDMIFKASLEELLFLQEYPRQASLTEESIQLINNRINELKKELEKTSS